MRCRAPSRRAAPRCWAPRRGGSGTCERCAAAPPAFEALRTPYRFAGLARRALLEAKFRGVTALLEPLGQAAAETVAPAWRLEAVAALPLHAARRRRRGFDQAELLARAVATALDVPLRTDLLRRARTTEAQATLDAAQRARNVAGAFAAETGDPPASLLLVDDVTTTGATLEAAARALWRERCGARGSSAYTRWRSRGRTSACAAGGPSRPATSGG